jgi:phosphate-selective porin OprO/OprP
MVTMNKVPAVLALLLFYPGIEAFAQESAPKAEAKPAVQEEKPKKTDEPIITATLKDGIHFRSSDGNFDATLGGYVQAHYRFTAGRHDDNARIRPDAFFLRRVRPEIIGTVYKDFDFRVLYDFPTSNNVIAAPAATGTLQDAYLGWRHYREISFRIGQFKEPFGQEETGPDRFVNFAERSESDIFTPQRDLGVMVYGAFNEGVLGYEAGYFNGQGRSTLDQNKGKEVAGRIRTQPFVGAAEDSPLKKLRLGLSGTTATVQREPINSSTFNNARSITLGIQYLTTPAVATNFLDGVRTRQGIEATWNWGPLGLRGEAWRRTDEVTTAAVHQRKFETRAWIVEATYLLTGESKPIEGRVVPANPFNVDTGDWGAFELAVKVDRLHFDRSIFSIPGVFSPPPASTNAVTDYAFGVNWYLTRNVRIATDFFWEVFADPLSLTSGKLDRHFFGGVVQFQLEF